jgi:hypothetical protein
MRAVWIAMLSGCGNVLPPALLCDAGAPTEGRLDAWSGGGMVDGFSSFVSQDGIRQHLLVNGDCSYRAYDVDSTEGVPVAAWHGGVLTADEAASIAERLDLGGWPASRDDSVPDAGLTHLSYGGDEFECFTCEKDRALVDAFAAVVGERVSAGAVVPPTGIEVEAWVAGTGGMAGPDDDDWRFAWSLARSPMAFVTTDRSAVAAAPDEVAFFGAVLDEARAGAFENGQWSFVTEDDGVTYQLYLREVLPPF